jgi:hypothetical protein
MEIKRWLSISEMKKGPKRGQIEAKLAYNRVRRGGWRGDLWRFQPYWASKDESFKASNLISG